MSEADPKQYSITNCENIVKLDIYDCMIALCDKLNTNPCVMIP